MQEIKQPSSISPDALAFLEEAMIQLLRESQISPQSPAEISAFFKENTTQVVAKAQALQWEAFNKAKDDRVWPILSSLICNRVYHQARAAGEIQQMHRQEKSILREHDIKQAQEELRLYEDRF
ncbi:hypothetical protein [Nodosilinea nodulosa]|uniref:hypothetical protein n=1 Tax=Nodosilinea nodulosa TaxID=416001 RepID=UPI0003139450|nr:hypothetical protein [Nodosilinea nodulosa]